jgi:hypothetical protein
LIRPHPQPYLTEPWLDKSLGDNPDVTLSVLLINDEWPPTRGGTSLFNRLLAIAFAAAGHRTACQVSAAAPIEIEDTRRPRRYPRHGRHDAVGAESLSVPVPEVVA